MQKLSGQKSFNSANVKKRNKFANQELSTK